MDALILQGYGTSHALSLLPLRIISPLMSVSMLQANSPCFQKFL